MIRGPSTLWSTATCLTLLVAAAACHESSPAGLETATPASVSGDPGAEPDLGPQLAALRALAARYRSFDAAQEAGYTIQATGCRSSAAGAMGVHWLNPAYLDGSVTPLEPEILVYEPGKNGRPSLVAVEYIVPFAIVSDTDPAPELFGRAFLPNAGDGVWMMHVWVGRHNPEGMFATWNPKVSCAHAD